MMTTAALERTTCPCCGRCPRCEPVCRILGTAHEAEPKPACGAHGRHGPCQAVRDESDKVVGWECLGCGTWGTRPIPLDWPASDLAALLDRWVAWWEENDGRRHASNPHFERDGDRLIETLRVLGDLADARSGARGREASVMEQIDSKDWEAAKAHVLEKFGPLCSRLTENELNHLILTEYRKATRGDVGERSRDE